jgi:hypothetical protein
MFLLDLEDVEWQPWRFTKPPKDFWNDKKVHQEYLLWLEAQLGIKELDDWYGISIEQIADKGGSSLLQQYGDSLYNLLCAIHPDHQWKKFAFHYLPKDFWEDKSKHYKCMEWLSQRLGITKLDDWYQVNAR